MADRHKNRPKAVRMPDGLEAWYRERAATTGQPLNAVLVAALEAFRHQHDGATTKRARKPAIAGPVREAATQSAVTPPVSRRLCPHQGTRVIGGWCPGCGVMVQPGGYLSTATEAP